MCYHRGGFTIAETLLQGVLGVIGCCVEIDWELELAGVERVEMTS